MNSCKPSSPCKVDGVFGVNAIAALWQQHHHKPFNCVPAELYQLDNVEGVSTIKTHEVYQVRLDWILSLLNIQGSLVLG